MRNKLIASVAGAVFSFAASGFAFAAPPPPPPAPVYSWTGWYVGGNVGYGWGDAHTDITGNATTFSVPCCGDQGLPASFAFADSKTTHLNGVIGGGQIGYNYQFNPQWVLGFEADIQGSGQRGSNTFVDPFSGLICIGRLSFGPCIPAAIQPVSGTAVTAYDAKIDWFGTVRGRVGTLIADQVLLYATGGLAYGQVEVSGSTSVSGAFVQGGRPFDNNGAPTALTASKTEIGFAAGGGLEGRFSAWLPPNWTWKLEYLYLDLGSLDTVSSFPGAVILASRSTTPLAGPINTHTHFTDTIVRVGLNYQFH